METKLQQYERLEREGPIVPEPLPEAKRRRLEGAARQYHNKRFAPYDYSSGVAAKDEAE